MSKLTTAQKAELVRWQSVLTGAGFPPAVIPFCLAQLAWESGWFTSATYRENNNPGGVKYTGRDGTKPGRKAGYNEGNNYAHYGSYDAYAQDYKRVLGLQLYGQKLGAPINASSIDAFVARCAANHYFTVKPGTVETYLNGLKSILSKISGAATVTATQAAAGGGGLLLLAAVAFFFFRK